MRAPQATNSEPGLGIVYLAATLCVAAVVYSALGCAVAWTGWTEGSEIGIAFVLSLFGLVFADDPNAVTGLCALITIAVVAVVAVFVLLLLLRARVARGALLVLTGAASAYEAYAVGYLFAHDVAAEGVVYLVLPAVGFLLWAGSFALVSLPRVGRALRARH